MDLIEDHPFQLVLANATTKCERIAHCITVITHLVLQENPWEHEPQLVSLGGMDNELSALHSESAACAIKSVIEICQRWAREQVDVDLLTPSFETGENAEQLFERVSGLNPSPHRAVIQRYDDLIELVDKGMPEDLPSRLNADVSAEQKDLIENLKSLVTDDISALLTSLDQTYEAAWDEAQRHLL